AVFIPSFFMQGAARALFVPLALAVGFSMIASYLLSSTLVPVLCVWLLKPAGEGHQGSSSSFFGRVQSAYGAALRGVLRLRWPLVPGSLALPVLLAGWWRGAPPGRGTEIFPAVDAGQFQLRLRAPDGTTLEDTEALARDVLDEIARQAGGPEN